MDRQGLRLVLAHLTRQCSVSNLTRLLSTMSATGVSIPTLVLSDEYYAEQALALLRIGAADYLTRPLDLSRLAYLVDVLTFRPAMHGRNRLRALPPPSPSRCRIGTARSPTYRTRRWAA